MGLVYIILFSILMYFLLWKVVDSLQIVDGPARLSRFRIKVFFHVFIGPALLVFLIFFVLLTSNRAFNIFIGIGSLIGSLLSGMLSQRKYLVNSSIDDSKVKIAYLTSLGKSKDMAIPITDISDAEMEKPGWLINYQTSININIQDHWVRFYLLDNKQKKEIQDQVGVIKNILPQ